MSDDATVRLVDRTFAGPPIDDGRLFDRLPDEVRALLRQINGFVVFNGGFHVRGACHVPDWHSLREAWEGDHALHKLYDAVRPDDLPLAEDAFGDQYLLRGSTVVRVDSETGLEEDLGRPWTQFLHDVQADPVGVLKLTGVEAFTNAGKKLEPGQTLLMIPPKATAAATDEVTNVALRAVSYGEARRYLPDLAKKLRALKPGEKLQLTVTTPDAD